MKKKINFEEKDENKKKDVSMKKMLWRKVRTNKVICKSEKKEEIKGERLEK